MPVHGSTRTRESRLVAERAGRFGPAPELGLVRSDGRGIRLRQGVQDSRPQRGDQGPACPDDGLAAVVAGRLRPLWRSVHPPGVARGGHLPHHRRPRRRRRRPAAVRAAEQLAGQRQPRQGAPAVVADQAEVRPQALVGRPDGAGRQRCAGLDGLQDVRLCRRTRRRVGAGRAATGVPRARGSATNATAANASFRSRSARCRWA